MRWLSYVFVGSVFLYLAGTVGLELVDRFWSDRARERIDSYRPLHLGMQAVFLLLLVSGVLHLFI